MQETGLSAGTQLTNQSIRLFDFLHAKLPFSSCRRQTTYAERATKLLQVLKFAQDLGLEEVKVKEVGCLGEGLAAPLPLSCAAG